MSNTKSTKPTTKRTKEPKTEDDKIHKLSIRALKVAFRNVGDVYESEDETGDHDHEETIKDVVAKSLGPSDPLKTLVALHKIYSKLSRNLNKVQQMSLSIALVLLAKNLAPKNNADDDLEYIDACSCAISTLHGDRIYYTIIQHRNTMIDIVSMAREALVAKHIPIRDGTPSEIADLYIVLDDLVWVRELKLSLCAGCSECK